MVVVKSSTFQLVGKKRVTEEDTLYSLLEDVLDELEKRYRSYEVNDMHYSFDEYNGTSGKVKKFHFEVNGEVLE